MAAAASLIPELERVVRDRSPQRRALTLKRITELFLNGADRFKDEHVRLFDDVFNLLINEIETKARAELSERLAPVANAPSQTVRRLAQDDDISVAGPVLRGSRRLAESDLVDIAETMSQAHLLAISSRTRIAEPITDVLVRRGNRAVARNVADNPGARLSDGGFTTLVTRAEQDDVLAQTVGLRPDIPPHLFRALVLRATAVVQQRLLAAADPATSAEIRRVLDKISDEVGTKAAKRDYSEARRTIEAVRRQGKLDENSVAGFAKTNQYEEMVVALSDLCSVPVDVVDRLMGGERPDPILILCKSLSWGWPTARAIIGARLGGRVSSKLGLDAACSNFERLTQATAQRVIRFWQALPKS